MSLIEWCAFAFLAGVTVYGVFGSLLEIVSGERLSFAPPFSSSNHPWRLALSPLVAGPLMLLNDALESYRNREISILTLAGCAATSLVWTSAMGVAMIEAVRLLGEG